MPRAPEVVRFGDFELDIPAYELRRKGEPVKLERRPMDLLIFLVERRGELVTRTDIVDQLWGKDVFIEAESAVNTAIRKIRRALDETPESPIFIETVAGKGYRFSAPAPLTSLVPPARAVDLRMAALAAASIAAIVGLFWSYSSATDDRPMQLVAVTTLPGEERGPSLSPDGSQVAFGWSGEARDNWDIYVTLVGSADVRRLTTSPARDIAARWSSDGRHIAYFRASPVDDVEHLRVMTALGGSDRQISDLPLLPQPAWSPDDQWIAAGLAVNKSARPGGIYIFALDGREPRQVTRATAGGADWMPAFSPDGQYLAYAACKDFTSNCDLRVVDLDRQWNATGSSRSLAASIGTVRSVAWTRDSSSMIYGAIDGAVSELRRVRVDGGLAERVELAGANALFPATSRTSDRLMFTRGVIDQDVYLFTVGGHVNPVARSSVFDGNGQLAPDGERVAFCSDRAVGATEIWIAAVDGSRSERLTHGPGRWQCSPAWSRDGRSIAFESRDSSGESQIHVIDVETHRMRQLTTGADHRMPSWSRSGQWIYFSRDDDRGRDIWRVQPDGTSLERVTMAGSGLAATESSDGTTLFFLGRRAERVHEPTDAPLMAQTLNGGSSRQVISCVRGTAFSVGDSAIYYLPCQSSPGNADKPTVMVVDIATGKERAVGTLEGYENTLPSGFSASPDGRTFVYNRMINRGEDLMLIENFR